MILSKGRAGKIHVGYFLMFFSALTSVASAQNKDVELLRRINSAESDFKNNFFAVTSNTTYVVNMAVPAAIGLRGIVKHDQRLKEEALYMGGGLVLTSVLAQGMKRIILRERPFEVYPDIVKRTNGGGYSMPSGHTAAAFYTAASLSFWHPRWYVVVPAFTWASLVGYGRIYQGVHYPSDVLVGALLGSGTAWFTFKSQKWMQHRKKKRENNKGFYTKVTLLLVQKLPRIMPM
jgi:membrane-associated phospholipid phosphatase